MIESNIELLSILIGGLMALASGLVGAFALMRKMTLAADAMSHIALPGLGIALLFGINPIIGGAFTLFLGALLVWGLENKTRISTETIIGVVFSASLAIGSLITPAEELMDALFGGFKSFTPTEITIGFLASIFIITFVYFFKEKIVLSLVSPELAKMTGLNSGRINLYFLLVFTSSIILGLKFLGALLMGSLIIIPAAAAKNISWNLNSFLVISAIISATSVLLGIFVSLYFNLASGPIIISIASFIFFLSLFWQRN